MAAGRLFRVVSGRVASHHVEGCMPEEVLHIELSRILLKGPRREGMAEAVRVNLRDAGFTRQPAKHLLESVRQ